MYDILRNSQPERQKLRAWLYSALIVIYATFFMVSGNSGDADASLILNMDPMLLLVVQGVVSTLMFIVFSLLFIRYVLKLSISEFFPTVNWIQAGMLILITISFMVVNSAVGEWNMSVNFPDSDFENWARKSEDQLKVLTEHITNFQTFGHFFVAFIVVAIIPAIGEELLFRGLLQNFLGKAFSNPHIAIWVSGFIFAAIHMQFYGVVPRMLLGVLFGYLYFWSGKLSTAMIAHLINNGFALILLYLAKTEIIEATPEQMESSAPWPAVLVFGIIFIASLKMFYSKFSKTDE